MLVLRPLMAIRERLRSADERRGQTAQRKISRDPIIYHSPSINSLSLSTQKLNFLIKACNEHKRREDGKKAVYI